MARLGIAMGNRIATGARRSRGFKGGVCPLGGSALWPIPIRSAVIGRAVRTDVELPDGHQRDRAAPVRAGDRAAAATALGCALEGVIKTSARVWRLMCRAMGGDQETCAAPPRFW